MEKKNTSQSWWTTLPGILTGIAAILGGVAAILAAKGPLVDFFFPIKLPQKCDEVLIDTGNTLRCDTTASAVFTLSSKAKVKSISVWYNTNLGGLSLPFQMQGIQHQGIKIAGVFQATGCDPDQSHWCEGKFLINEIFLSGQYIVLASIPAICQNQASQANGFVKWIRQSDRMLHRINRSLLA